LFSFNAPGAVLVEPVLFPAEIFSVLGFVVLKVVIPRRFVKSYAASGRHGQSQKKDDRCRPYSFHSQNYFNFLQEIYKTTLYGLTGKLSINQEEGGNISPINKGRRPYFGTQIAKKTMPEALPMNFLALGAYRGIM
jgi:hypothetical protein